MRGVLPPGVSLEAGGLQARGSVIANKTQLTQVLTNLIVNAGHAMNGQGNVRVALGEVDPGLRQAETLGLAAGRRHLTIAVSDDGCGMGSNNIKSDGPGLGLIIMRRRAKQIGAEIDWSSDNGSGTTVTVVFSPEARERRAL